MGSALLLWSLTVGEVLKVTCLLSLDDRLEFQTAKLADDVFRSEGIASSGWESSSKFLRGQVFHRLSHIVLLLGTYR